MFFHARSLSNLDKLPSRKPSQRWVVHTKESAQNGHSGNRIAVLIIPSGLIYTSRMDGVKTVLTTTKQDGRLFQIKLAWYSGLPLIVTREVKGKITSVQKLEKYIQVDTYGHCGDHALPKTKNDHKCGSFCQKYKFYLAFENSFCSEYVTEKLYKII